MASAEFTSSESTQAVPTVETPSDQEQVNVDTSTSTEIESTAAIFQAVGVITGDVNFTNDGQSTVTIGSYEYPLYYSKRQWNVLKGFSRDTRKTGHVVNFCCRACFSDLPTWGKYSEAVTRGKIA